MEQTNEAIDFFRSLTGAEENIREQVEQNIREQIPEIPAAVLERTIDIPKENKPTLTTLTFGIYNKTLNLRKYLDEILTKSPEEEICVADYDGGNDSGEVDLSPTVNAYFRENPNSKLTRDKFLDFITDCLGHGSWASDGTTWTGSIYWDGDNFIKRGSREEYIYIEEEDTFDIDDFENF